MEEDLFEEQPGAGGGAEDNIDAPDDLNAYVPLVGILEKADKMVETTLKMARNHILNSIVQRTLENACRKALKNRVEAKVKEIAKQKIQQFSENAYKELPTMVAHGIVNAIGEAELKTLGAMVDGTYVCSKPCKCSPGCPGKKKPIELPPPTTCNTRTQPPQQQLAIRPLGPS